MSNGVGVTRSERRDLLLERIATSKNQIAAYSELADLIDETEARSVSHQQIWHAVAQRLRADARTLREDQDQAEARLADITAAAIAHDNHIPVRTPRVIETTT